MTSHAASELLPAAPEDHAHVVHAGDDAHRVLLLGGRRRAVAEANYLGGCELETLGLCRRERAEGEGLVAALVAVVAHEDGEHARGPEHPGTVTEDAA